MSKGRILVIDDEQPILETYSGLLEQAGYVAITTNSAEKGLEIASSSPIDVVITDLRMPGMDGMAFLHAIAERAPELPVVMLTAYGTIADAVNAMKAGARDFLTKSGDRNELLYTIEKVIASSPAAPPRQEIAAPNGIIAVSDAMQACFKEVQRAASAPAATVLLLGESGSGKEVLASAIHELSARKPHALVKTNVAAIPSNLLESELFGYEKGAFTGAQARKPGRIELADKGTFFLDEVGHLPIELQPKLLRVIQEKEFERLGGTRSEKVDVRWIAATSRDLRARMAEGKFREDLFFRLNVVPISVPPLRQRADDIEPLTRHFLKRVTKQNGRGDMSLTDGALALLRGHAWPGNVRELENLVERLVIFTDATSIGASDVERELRRLGAAPTAPLKDGSIQERVQSAESDAIREALKRTKGNKTAAARVLGIARRTLYNKLEELGIKA